jgi:hypothetical protein
MISDGLTMIIPKSLNIVLKLRDNIVLHDVEHLLHGVEHHSHTCIARYGSFYTGYLVRLLNQSKPKLAFSTKSKMEVAVNSTGTLGFTVSYPSIPSNHYSQALLPLSLQLF